MLLDDPLQVELVRRECRRGPVDLAEATDRGASGWLAGSSGPRIAEVVFPLHRRAERAAHPRAPTRAAATIVPAKRIAQPTGCHLPGGDWLSAAVRTPPRWQDDVLARVRTDLLPALRDAGCDRWFFVRYADPGGVGVLRLRFRSPAGDGLSVLHAWAQRRQAENLITDTRLETYRQEVIRYGGAAAIDAAEGASTADSELALQALADQPAEPEARAAIELVDVFDAFGTTPPRGDRASRGADARRERAQIDRVRPGVRAVTAAGCPEYRSPAAAAARSALSHYAGAVAGLTRTGDCTASTDRIVGRWRTCSVTAGSGSIQPANGSRSGWPTTRFSLAERADRRRAPRLPGTVGTML